MRLHARAPRFAAFTLIEVLVSLAIFALAAVILGATYVNVLSGYEAVGKRNTHEQDLRFVRTAVVLGEPDRKLVEVGGEIGLPDNRAARWEAMVEETEIADLFQVVLKCEVRESGQGRPWSAEEKFMLLRPTWSEPAKREELREKTKQRLLEERGKTR